MNNQYNLEQFDVKIHHINNLESLQDMPLANGIYHCDDERLFDVYVENIEEIENSSVLICFNAAVGKRTELVAPFFSGKGVNKALNKTLFSFSDPAVSSTELTAGWYMGDKANPELQKEIAAFLDYLALKYHCRFVLFGGSGAGFASLAISSLLNENTQAQVCTFNPQTIVSSYYFGFVKKCVELAFGIDNIIDNKQAYDVLEKLAVVHHVNYLSFKDNVKILYLQNKMDKFHWKSHLVPFIASSHAKQYARNSLLLNDNKLGIYLGNWGEGHAAPPGSVVINILKLMLDNKTIPTILQALENGLNGTNPISHGEILYFDPGVYSIHPQLKIDKNSVSVSIAVKKNGLVFHHPEIRYAAYLLQGKDVISKQFYQDDNHFSFDVSGIKNTEQLYVRVFVIDHFNNKIIKNTDKFTVDLSNSIKVIIAGSCVTRDAFVFPSSVPLNLVAYYARSSLAVYSAKHLNDDLTNYLPQLDNIPSSFQKRMVMYDFTRHLYKHIEEYHFDFIIFDFIDERLGLALIDDSLITRSNEFVASKIKPTRLISNHEHYIELFKSGANILFSKLQKLNLLHKVIIHECYYAENLSDGSDFDADALEHIRTKNLHMAQIHEFIKTLNIPSQHYIQVDPKYRLANIDHKWGVSPFHFIDEYYHQFNQQLAALLTVK